MTATRTQIVPSFIKVIGESPNEALPTTLPIDLSNYAKLSPEQVGHLRHFYNLAFQPDGEWRFMGTADPGQEFLDAYRYQLATMAYAASLAHYHRLPAVRTVFKPMLRQLIHKMLRRDVWGYWFLTSHGNSRTDPSLQELRKPWADPVARENIMYSGHLLLMTSLYGMLFDDDEFEKDDSLVFRWDPMFFGFGPESFKYSNRSLQKVILAEMEQTGWIGVCCEPNVVFIVCNQFPLIAVRYNDVRDGTDVAGDIMPKYTAAWEKKNGFSQNDGRFVDWWMVKQDHIFETSDLAWSAWTGAFMHSWNPALVEALYERQILGFITKTSGQFNLQPPIVAKHYRAILANHTHEDETVDDLNILSKAVALAKKEIEARTGPPFPYNKPCFGYVVQWLSELGKADELSSLLSYADENLNPEWFDGGLYYRREDSPFKFGNDDTVKWTFVSPYTGNAAIGYGRLNVKDGQKIMYENPWSSEHIEQTPWIDNLDFVRPGTGVSVLRGQWDGNVNALILTVKGWDYQGKGCDESVTINPVARNLHAGTWGLYIDGALTAAKDVQAGESFEVSLVVKRGEERDIIFLKA